MAKRLTTEEFIERARRVHGDLYDYSLVEYKNTRSKVSILCEKHDFVFNQIAQLHLSGNGCKYCGAERGGKKNKMTKDRFISKANLIHGGKYSYELVDYVDRITPIKIKCFEHGEFSQRPMDHLSKHGCKQCGINKMKANSRINFDEFVDKARKVHGNKYKYFKEFYNGFLQQSKFLCGKHGYFSATPKQHCRKVCVCPACRSEDGFKRKIWNKFGGTFKYNWDNYLNIGDEILVTCDEHGEFSIKPERFLVLKYGCVECSKCYGPKKLRKYKDYFVKIANKTHNNKYDYSLVPEDCRQLDLVKIICPSHNEFLQKIGPHAYGLGCQKCSNSKPVTFNEFSKRAKDKHGDKYDYSEAKYTNYKKEITIICPKHGRFLQKPNQHIIGNGCQKCGMEISGLKQRTGTEKFIKRANEIHGERYKYNKVKYITAKDKVIISCDDHGDFLQTPDNHINLARGCPQCRMSKGELEIFKFLRRNNIKFEREKSFETCKNPRTGWKLRFDFYIEDYNTLIEFDGLQHESDSTSWEKMSDLDAIKFRDEVKNNWSIENKIKLIRIPYSEKQNINKILMEEFKICLKDV